MMRILFIEAKQNDKVAEIRKYNLRPVGLRLGPFYLASYLRSENSNVKISIQENRLRSTENISYDLAQEIKDNDVIAISCMTNEFPDALRMMRIAKEFGKVIILGGLFPSANSEFVLKTQLADFVVHGEGELSLSSLIKCLQEDGEISNVKGISYVESGAIVCNPSECLLTNIDIIPAYDLISMGSYAKYGRGPVMSARGCPHSCTFCTLAPHWRHEYRVNSFENVAAQIKCFEEVGFKHMNIIDETFTLDKNRSIELLHFLIDKREKSELKLLPTQVRSRIDTIDLSLIKLLINANIDLVQIGVETVSSDGLRNMSKNLKEFEIERTLDTILDAGISLNPIFIFGYQGQTKDSIKNDMKFIKKLASKPNVTTYISFNTPHPGSYNWINARKAGLHILTGDVNYYNHKMLVCVPESMGDPEYSSKLIQECYNEIVKDMNMEHENPFLDNLDYIINSNPDFNHIENIWCE